MNNFKTIIRASEKKWDNLRNSKVPIIYLGTASCGLAAGANKVKEVIKSTLKENKIKAKFVEVGCIGPCYLEPLMDVAIPGHPRISYGNVNEKLAKKIIEKNLIEGDNLKKIALGHFGDEEYDGIDPFFDHPMLKDQTRIVLKNCGIIDPEDISQYIALGGYKGFYNIIEQKPESGKIPAIDSEAIINVGAVIFNLLSRPPIS